MGVSPSVVRVCVDSSLPHLDRLFDYSVPQKLTGVVAVGTRVRIPFHGRLVGGIVCEIVREGGFEGRLSDVHSAGFVPSTTLEGIDLARRVARRYGGSLWDVLRLAVPPRVASVEKRWMGGGSERADGERVRIVPAAERARDEAGAAWTEGPRLVWEAVPEPDRSSLPLAAVLAPILEAAVDGSAILIVPDARAVTAVMKRLKGYGLRRWTARGGGEVAVIHTDDGPTIRYENYLAALYGVTPVVVGTRSTVFQPVPHLTLLSVWADGNSAYQDPHAPYPHARMVAAIRSETEGAALVLGAWSPSIEGAALVENGWADWAPAKRSAIREAAPAIEVLTGSRRDEEGSAGRHWMPSAAWRVVTEGVVRGPVFVLVPRAGYVTMLACSRCGQRAICSMCGGPLVRGGKGLPPVCGDCGRGNPDWHCPECHEPGLSETRQGSESIASQVRRMAPTIDVSVSSAESGILDDGTVSAGIVVATPGAIPAVTGGYAAGVVVGADGGLGRSGTEVDAASLWFQAAALVRSRVDGGRVTVVGDLEPTVKRALETWTPGDLARRAARERSELGLPPFRRVIRLEASPSILDKARVLRIGKAPLAHHPDITEVSSDGTLLLLAGRRIAQEAVDELRVLVKEASAEGLPARLRVDGSLEVDKGES